MTTRGGYSMVAALVTTWVVLWTPLHATIPDYKLGEVVAEDVVTPVELPVFNPDATETLKREVAEQAPVVFRHAVPVAAEVEADLRARVVSTRGNFLAAFTQALYGRPPTPADIDTPVYLSTIRDLENEAPKYLPFARLAPLWVRGADDEPVVASLLQSVREVMALGVYADEDQSYVPTGKPVRLIQVQSVTDSPSLQELERFGVATGAANLISLTRARSRVENHFPAGEEDLSRFASSFIRVNAYPAPGLTEILRVRRIDGITVSDNYAPAQTILRKGQIVDRKALSALAAVREKNLIGTLQTKLEQEQTVTGQLTQQTKWIVAGFGGVGFVLLLILRRLRSRPVESLVSVPANFPVLPAAATQAPILTDNAIDSAWRSRALAAEGKAQRAQEAIRTGALAWMREKLFQTLFHQRAELLLVHQKAEGEMREFEMRLERLHTALQGRISAYEKRIEELERELAAKGEENRELIGARISVAKQQLNAERGRFGSN